MNWLGTRVAPGAFMLNPFWPVMLVIFVAGIPSYRVVKAPVRCLEGPITVPDATPVATPALSPELMVPMVIMVWAGMKQMNIVLQAVPGFAVSPWSMFGYGMGVTPEGEGVLQVSGQARFTPPIWVFTNMLTSYTMDLLPRGSLIP
jgi:hypothetical protein